MPYIKDRRDNPIRRNGSYVLLKTKFTAVLKGQWGNFLPPYDLLSQDDINNYLATIIPGYSLLSYDLPVVSSVQPTYVEEGQYNYQLIIRGKYFKGASSVTINGIPYDYRIGFGGLGRNSSTIYIYNQVIKSAGPVVVSNANGDSNTDVSVLAAPVVTFTDINPKSGSDADIITVTGTGLDTIEQFYFGGYNTYFRVISPTEIQFNPIAYIQPGTVTFYAVRYGRNIFPPDSLTFDFRYAPMTITSVTPNPVRAYQYLYAYGSNFHTNGLEYSLNGTSNGSIYSYSPDFAYIYIYPGATSGKLTITNNTTGQGSVTTDFDVMVEQPSTITSFTPRVAYRSTAPYVTVYGTKFLNTSYVYAYSSNYQYFTYFDFTIISDTEIRINTSNVYYSANYMLTIASQSETINFYDYYLYVY
jgi:hypothetical protein